MFHLHLSNRTENLLTNLVEVLRSQPRRDPFAKEIFLIQSQGMERMLSQRLADAFSVWCNFEYLLPTRFFDRMASNMGLIINPDAFNRDALSWRIDSLLHQITVEAQQPAASMATQSFAPILRYISGEQSSLKRYQLAQQLANIFDQYQIMRPEMLDGWQRQKKSTTNPAEEWQMLLWAQLRASLDNTPHRGEMLRRFLQCLQRPEDFPAIPPATPGASLPAHLSDQPWPARLSVFGLHSMPPLLLDCLHAVSYHCEVHLYLLTPCRNYWADIPGKRQLVRENIARMKDNREAAPLNPEVHPLLSSLGKQGQDFQAMLLERIDNLEDSENFADPLQNGVAAPCLLHRLQSDLLDGGWKEQEDDETIPLDSSLTIVSCHSAVREVMILKDQILRWLQDNPDMELRDIVVMAPDIQEYSAIIPAIFHDIQHSIADRSLRHQNKAMAIFFQFLDLAVSRFSWSEVLDLLEKPEVAPALSESDCELIHHWVTDTGIRWGLSTRQLHDLGLPRQAETTWQAGLDRLLMGYAMNWDLPVDGILPYRDIEGSQARPLGGLCQFIELLSQAEEDLGRPRPLADWSALLLAFMNALFAPSMEDDLTRLREILNSLGSRFGALNHHDIPLEVVRAWLETTASESKSSAGFLRGQLTFCSMLPMRSIPFQAVCLLGLNDGVFPKTDRHPPFDLLGEKFIPGDRSKRGDDRYQFLEALLSARRYLYLSHVGQSIRSGRVIPPSVLITELVEALQLSYGIEDPVRKHPLQPFSSRYFRGNDLFSYNGHDCKVAKALTGPLPTQSPQPWWTGTLPDDADCTVNISDLFSFFAHPQKWFVRNRLDIQLDNEADLPEENELFAITGLDGYLINQELVQSCLESAMDAGQGRPSVASARDGAGATGAGTTTDQLARLKAQGRWMLGTPGQLAFDRLLPELKNFAARVQAQNMGRKLPDLPLDLPVGDYRLVGQLTGIYENGILLARYTNCKGKDLLRAWIHHLLANMVTPSATHLLTKDCDLCFAPCTDPLPQLAGLIPIYRQGFRTPSPLLVEPAWTFIQQQNNPRGQLSPLQAAQKALKESMENGYEPELTLLFGACDPAALLGPEFQQLCEDLLTPILAAGENRP